MVFLALTAVHFDLLAEIILTFLAFMVHPSAGSFPAWKHGTGFDVLRGLAMKPSEIRDPTWIGKTPNQMLC